MGVYCRRSLETGLVQLQAKTKQPLRDPKSKKRRTAHLLDPKGRISCLDDKHTSLLLGFPCHTINRTGLGGPGHAWQLPKERSTASIHPGVSFCFCLKPASSSARSGERERGRCQNTVPLLTDTTLLSQI